MYHTIKRTKWHRMLVLGFDAISLINSQIATGFWRYSYLVY